MRSRRRLRSRLADALLGAAGLAGVIALLVGPAQARPQADPILGRWTNGTWSIEVRPAGANLFTGELLKPAKIAGCTYPARWQIWLRIQKKWPGESLPGFPGLTADRYRAYWGVVYWDSPPHCLEVHRRYDHQSVAVWTAPVTCPNEWAGKNRTAVCMSEIQRTGYGTGKQHLVFFRRIG
jgi:hypothetical protein